MSKYGINQIGFQNSATPIAEGIIDLHDYIMFYIIIVFIFVPWVYFDILFQNFEIFNFQISQNLLIKNFNTEFNLRRLYFFLNRINHATNLEIVWTLLPSLVLIVIAIPSLSLLYSMDELLYPKLTLKVIGFQWYWTYEYSDLFVKRSFMNGYIENLPTQYQNKKTLKSLLEQFKRLPHADLVIESYMIPDADLFKKKHHRLLSTDKIIVLPIDIHIRVLVTGADVLHSWAVPSLGIKIDAVPGRLNQVAMYLKRQGIFYGQCSELCGVNHGFMPIVLKAVHYPDFVKWMYSLTVTELGLANHIVIEPEKPKVVVVPKRWYDYLWPF